MSEPPKLAEVLAELEALSRAADTGPDGFTVEELARHLGLGHRGASYRLRVWADAGLVRFVGKRRVVNVAGGTSVVPVYQPCSASGS